MCTLMTIKTKDGAWITGRTNEFMSYYGSELVFKPRFSKFKSAFLKENKYTWENKYSFIYENALKSLSQEEFVIDGMNEKGLSVSMLSFSYHDWKELDRNDIKKHNINIVLLPSYILGNMSSVKEVRKSKDKLEEMFYWEKGVSQKELGQHISIIDSTGDSIVIEPENKQIIIKENPLRVLTNSSPLEYHYENLRNYSHLNPNRTEINIIWRGLKREKLFMDGQGLLGLPGDFSANSRFIRAATFVSLVDEFQESEEGVSALFRMLNTSDIVPGFMIDNSITKEFKNTYSNLIYLQKEKEYITSQTDNMIVKDLKNLKLYYKTYDNLSIRVIDFKEILNSKKTLRININKDKVSKFHKVKLINI